MRTLWAQTHDHLKSLIAGVEGVSMALIAESEHRNLFAENGRLVDVGFVVEVRRHLDRVWHATRNNTWAT